MYKLGVKKGSGAWVYQYFEHLESCLAYILHSGYIQYSIKKMGGNR